MNVVKGFIGSKDRCFGKINASAINANDIYNYNNIGIQIQYNVPYMQMSLDIIWEGDASQPPYKSLGLHGGYHSSFQNFIFSTILFSWKTAITKS